MPKSGMCRLLFRVVNYACCRSYGNHDGVRLRVSKYSDTVAFGGLGKNIRSNPNTRREHKLRSVDCGQSRFRCGGDDNGQIGSAMKSFKFLLFMTLHKSNGLIKDQ